MAFALGLGFSPHPSRITRATGFAGGFILSYICWLEDQFRFMLSQAKHRTRRGMVEFTIRFALRQALRLGSRTRSGRTERRLQVIEFPPARLQTISNGAFTACREGASDSCPLSSEARVMPVAGLIAMVFQQPHPGDRPLHSCVWYRQPMH